MISLSVNPPCFIEVQTRESSHRALSTSPCTHPSRIEVRGDLHKEEAFLLVGRLTTYAQILTYSPVGFSVVDHASLCGSCDFDTGLAEPLNHVPGLVPLTCIPACCKCTLPWSRLSRTCLTSRSSWCWLKIFTHGVS